MGRERQKSQTRTSLSLRLTEGTVVERRMPWEPAPCSPSSSRAGWDSAVTADRIYLAAALSPVLPKLFCTP